MIPRRNDAELAEECSMLLLLERPVDYHGVKVPLRVALQLDDDQALYGNAFLQKHSDGTGTRIRPEEMLLFKRERT